MIVDAETGDPMHVLDADRKEDFFTFFVGVTDEDEYRTDSNILVSFDVKNGTIDLLNVPRDTMSNVSRSNKKINGAYNNGIEATLSEMYKLTQIPVDKYVIVNFEGIADIVDAIGGVEYDVPRRMKYDDPTQDLHINLQAGPQTLNGEQAVGLLRFRMNNDGTGYAMGDIDRIELQQDFLKELLRQAADPSNLWNVEEIANAVFDNVETDLELGEIIWLGLEAIKIDMDDFQTHTIGIHSYPVINGIDYVVVDERETLEIINEHMNPFVEDIKDLDVLFMTSTPKPDPEPEPEPEPDEPETDPEDPEAGGTEDPEGGDTSENPEDGGDTGEENPDDTTEPTVPPVDGGDEEPEEPTDPTDPTNPEVPEEPTDPDPTEPPTEPTEPDPTEPEPTPEPVEPTVPTEPNEPTEPTTPTEPNEPVVPPVDPETAPVDPETA